MQNQLTVYEVALDYRAIYILTEENTISLEELYKCHYEPDYYERLSRCS